MTTLADRPPAAPAPAPVPVSHPAAGLGALEEALQVLLSPLDYPDWQTWQVAVHGRLLALAGADALCVYTPLGGPGAAGAGAWYAPHLSEAALAAYGARAAADPDWDVIERSFAVSGRELAHEDQLLPPGALAASAFYRDFLLPHGILDLTVASAAFGGEEPARLHFSNRVRRPAERTAEAMALVRAVLPAFRAGLGLWRQLGERRAELARVLDALPDAVLLYETSGTLVHANPAAARHLDDPADAERLRAEAQRLAWSVGAVARREPAPARAGRAPAAPPAASRTLRVGAGPTARTLTLRAALAPAWMLGRDPGVLVTVEAAAARPLTDAELRDRFALTSRELEAARLVAEGLSNQAIAERMGVSFFTARNHVERLLAKLGASNRAHVGTLLREAA
jgi:DNA-binding CsgD family transcriptional regulator/PAS domain-containing protein